MSKFLKALLVASLFLPLWACVLIVYGCSLVDNFKNIKNYKINFSDWICLSLSVFLFFVSLFSFIWSLRFIKNVNKRKNNYSELKVRYITKKSSYTLNFLSTFIIPFFSFYSGLNGTFVQIGKFVVCLLYLLMISIVYYKNRILFTNVMFELFNYSFFEAESSSKKYLIVTNKNIISQENPILKVKLIANEIATID